MNELESLWVFTVVTHKGPQKVGAPTELDRVLIEVLNINIPAHLCQVAVLRCTKKVLTLYLIHILILLSDV